MHHSNYYIKLTKSTFCYKHLLNFLKYLISIAYSFFGNCIDASYKLNPAAFYNGAYCGKHFFKFLLGDDDVSWDKV